MSRLAHDVRSSFITRHAGLWLLLSSLALGCAKTQTPGEGNNGNTNWLRRCTSTTDCEDGDSCVKGVCEGPSAPPADDASSADSTPSAATFDAGAVRWGLGGPPTLVEGERLCGGVACASNQLCCYRSGTCFDAGDATACPTPAVGEVPGLDPGVATPCASDADCAENEACTGAARCLGVGVCQPRTNCGSSSGQVFCGCDGLDYPDLQSACVAGARIAADAPCGVTYIDGAGGGYAERPPLTGCGNSDDCSAPDECCQLTGRCYDATEPILCTVPPEGTESPCLDDTHCGPGRYCKHQGCEGPGGCVGISGGECGGRFEPVCGCDGTSYTSAECADAAGTNVSHSGACEG